MSFLKYRDEHDNGNGDDRGSLSFGRAHLDGMPSRGPMPLLKEEEFNEFTEVVSDFNCGIYDVSDNQQHAALRDIFDKAVNGWYNIVDYDKQWGKNADGKTTMMIYIAYSIPHRELAKGRAKADLMMNPVPQFPGS